MFFCLTMNDIELIDKTLLNRLFITNIVEYTFKEKCIIIQQYTIPKILKMRKVNFSFDDQCYPYFAKYDLSTSHKKIDYIILQVLLNNTMSEKPLREDLQKNITHISMGIVAIFDTNEEKEYNPLYL